MTGSSLYSKKHATTIYNICLHAFSVFEDKLYGPSLFSCCFNVSSHSLEQVMEHLKWQYIYTRICKALQCIARQCKKIFWLSKGVHSNASNLTAYNQIYYLRGYVITFFVCQRNKCFWCWCTQQCDPLSKTCYITHFIKIEKAIYWCVIVQQKIFNGSDRQLGTWVTEQNA